MFCGNFFACFNTPKARETFLGIVSTYFFQVRCLSIWRPRYFVSSTFWIFLSSIFKSSSSDIFWCFWRDRIFPLSQWSRLSRSLLRVSFRWAKLPPRKYRPLSSTNFQTNNQSNYDRFQYCGLFQEFSKCWFTISFMTTLTETNFILPRSLGLDLCTLSLLASLIVPVTGTLTWIRVSIQQWCFFTSENPRIIHRGFICKNELFVGALLEGGLFHTLAFSSKVDTTIIYNIMFSIN